MHDNQSPHFHGTDCRHKRKSEISLFSVKPSTINMGPNSQIKFFSLQLVPNASEIKRSSQSWVLVVIKKVDYGVHKTRFWKFLKINGMSNIIDPTSTNMGWYIKTRPEPLDIVYGKTILSFNEKKLPLLTYTTSMPWGGMWKFLFKVAMRFHSSCRSFHSLICFASIGFRRANRSDRCFKLHSEHEEIDVQCPQGTQSRCWILRFERAIASRLHVFCSLEFNPTTGCESKLGRVLHSTYSRSPSSISPLPRMCSKEWFCTISSDRSIIDTNAFSGSHGPLPPNICLLTVQISTIPVNILIDTCVGEIKNVQDSCTFFVH